MQGKLLWQTGWNRGDANDSKRGKSESRNRGVGERLLSWLFYSLWGKDMFRKPSFRWLNIQIASLPTAPRSPPSSRVWLVMWRDEVMLHSSRQCWEASFPAPHPQMLSFLSMRPAFDVLVTWRTRGYQLAVNSVTILSRSQGQRRQLSQRSHPWSSGSAADWPN